MPSIDRSRSLAYHRQHGRCFYCYAPMWSADPSEVAKQYGITIQQARSLRCTAEHLRARQDGGDDSPGNIVAACLHCNNARHRKALPPATDVYRATVQSRMIKRRWQGGWFFSSRSLVSATSILTQR